MGDAQLFGDGLQVVLPGDPKVAEFVRDAEGLQLLLREPVAVSGVRRRPLAILLQQFERQFGLLAVRDELLERRLPGKLDL